MPCGCTSACGCNVVAGSGISVQVIGDKIIVSSTAVPLGSVPVFIQSTQPSYAGGPYVWYETDPDTEELVTVWVETGGAP